MAISYTKVGWDTSKYVNPTNMNQMDNGIKAACDGVDTINGGTITGGTIALKSNLPQIVSLYNSTPTQSNITLSVPSGFTPLLLYISTTNSSASSGSRSVFTLPIGMYGYIPLNVAGTSEYIRLESAVSGSTYSLNFLGSSGSDTYIQMVKALGYYS